jgi:hypothetical protein
VARDEYVILAQAVPHEPVPTAVSQPQQQQQQASDRKNKPSLPLIAGMIADGLLAFSLQIAFSTPP